MRHSLDRRGCPVPEPCRRCHARPGDYARRLCWRCHKVAGLLGTLGAFARRKPPAVDRGLVRLWHWRGLSDAGIARQLGVSRACVSLARQALALPAQGKPGRRPKEARPRGDCRPLALTAGGVG